MNYLYRLKKSIAEKIKDILGDEDARQAARDHHAKRLPRHCGMTIHTGIGCNMGCVYCYIRDMGFPLKPQPYPLSPLQLVYALTLNPYVVPKRTLAAYGSVTEPFLPETSEKAISYMKEVHRWLELPSQVSTKQEITPLVAKKLREIDPGFSVLISVSSWDGWAKKLEPGAPPPSARIASARHAVEAGLHVSLFIRPIIPGITDRDAVKLINAASESGIQGMVLGSLRVTPDIIRRLDLAGVEPEPILQRLHRQPKPNVQVPINTVPEKERIRKIAEEYKIPVYPSACSANIIAHGQGCNACPWGPCGKPVEVSEEDLQETLKIAGIQAKIRVEGHKVLVYAPNRRTAVRASRLISSGARLQAVIVKH